MLHDITEDFARSVAERIIGNIMSGRTTILALRGKVTGSVPYVDPKPLRERIAAGANSEVWSVDDGLVVQEIALFPRDACGDPLPLCTRSVAKRAWVPLDPSLDDALLTPVGMTTYRRQTSLEEKSVFALYYPLGRPACPARREFDLDSRRRFVSQTMPCLLELYASISDAGYVLGDAIKPNNCLRLPGGNLKVTDAESLLMTERTLQKVPGGLRGVNQSAFVYYTPVYTPITVMETGMATPDTDAEQAGIMIAVCAFGLHNKTSYCIGREVEKGNKQRLLRERREFIRRSHARVAEELGMPGLDEIVKGAMTGAYRSPSEFAAAVASL